MDAAALAALNEGSGRLGIELNSVQLERLDRYVSLLLRWNARIKLTSVTRPLEIVDKHLLDSLAVVTVLGGARDVVDIGSGAGLPGLVLAAVVPGLAVTVVESIHKKAAFLEAVRRELGLERVEVVAGRMEEVIAAGRRFSAAVSRATFAPEEWLARGEALVAPGGRLIAMVVDGAAQTPDALAPQWPQRFASARIESGRLPGRALVVLEGRLG